jgi:hypothetical protein
VAVSRANTLDPRGSGRRVDARARRRRLVNGSHNTAAQSVNASGG